MRRYRLIPSGKHKPLSQRESCTNLHPLLPFHSPFLVLGTWEARGTSCLVLELASARCEYVHYRRSNPGKECGRLPRLPNPGRKNVQEREEGAEEQEKEKEKEQQQQQQQTTITTRNRHKITTTTTSSHSRNHRRLAAATCQFKHRYIYIIIYNITLQSRAL